LSFLSLVAFVGSNFLREAIPPRNQPFASHSPRVFRSLEGICQLILLSVGHKGTTGRTIYNIKKSLCYCSDLPTNNWLPSL
jgi:hypothetical protein